jgi:hypothetical protein
MPEVIVKDGVESVEFFGKVDRNKDGKIASEVPSWYLRQHQDELKNDIARTENALAREEIPPTEKPLIKANLEKMKAKLDSVEASKPKIKGNEDVLMGIRKELGEEISNSMFTRSDMMKGVADAHEEARRMADPCIKLSGKALLLAEKAGAKISKGGMVSRTDAEKTWKLLSRALGENSNTETLRR